MFQFRFQSVLDYRKTLEEKRHSEFSEQREFLEKRIAGLESLRAERSRQMETLRAMDRVKVSPSDISYLSSYILSLREQETREEDVISQMRTALEEKRKELVEAMRQKKVMENLRERHFEEFQESEDKQENNQLDEFGVTRFRMREP